MHLEKDELLIHRGEMEIRLGERAQPAPPLSFPGVLGSDSAQWVQIRPAY